MASTGRAELFLPCSLCERTIAWPPRRNGTVGAELICKLEMIFPPSFFNPMQHLILHLPTEARLGGPCKIVGATQLRGCRRRFEQNVKINVELKHRWPRHSSLRRRQTSWQHTTKPKIAICIIRSLGTMLTTLKRVNPTSSYSKGHTSEWLETSIVGCWRMADHFVVSL